MKSGCFLVERGGFSVEGLLDLEEKDAVETEDAPPAAAAAEEAETEKKSQVTYELPLPPPPPEMVDLPAHDVEEELPQQQKKKNKKAEHGENDGGMPKKRGRKPKRKRHLTGAAAASVAASQQASAAQGERRCSHCGVQDTPQWRAGPKGAKTLCNACGVRYKSGRLLPEYRPACSPTFVSSIHSNSHRKVLEMRRNKEAEAEPPVASS